jgi:hypothetical protein
MQLSARAEIEIARPCEATFDFAAANESFPRVLLPFGPLPGITGVEWLDGALEPKPGARRLIHLSDGTTIGEELLTYDRPTRHRYRWSNPPAGPLSWLVRSGEGDWSFAPVDGGTRIVWRYRFGLTSALAAPLAWPIVLLFQRWMQRGLTRIRDTLEAQR